MPSSDPLPPKESALFRKILVSGVSVLKHPIKLRLFRPKKNYSKSIVPCEYMLHFFVIFTRFLKIHFMQVVPLPDGCYVW